MKLGRLDVAGEFEPDVKVRTREYRIGCIGAGMIMAECHLAAYKEAGFPVVAIASRTKANAEKVAARWGIPRVLDTPEALIEDPEVEIVDLAYPPDQQPALIRHALKQKHIKAILAQKPLALSVEEARKLRDEAAAAGIPPTHHFQHLLIHGVLHLMGYDHETDDEAERMEGLETALLARLGISDPYAEARA